MILLIATLLFSEFRTPYETKALVNIEGNFIIYARFYQGTLISIDSVISIPEYLDTGLRRHNQKLLLNVLKTQIIRQGSYANQGLFGTFEIPLPKGGFSDFMGETGKLDVGGYVKVTLGGAQTFMSNIPGQPGPSLIPELKMEQEMAINLDGQVGDRMRVFIDHNSTRVDETQNKIRVTYKGKEDEIIQEIEGGDTQLSIPSTSYTGDIPSHQGLFGIKSTAKLGPVDFVAIASKEQTQTEEMVIEGASQADSSKTWSKEYAKRQFFWLGTNDSITTLKVYVDDGNGSNDYNGITFDAKAFLDTNDDNIPDTAATHEIEEGSFTLKREGLDYDYRFLPGANIIELNTGLMNGEALGAYYIKINANGIRDTVGVMTDNPNDTMLFKLICARDFDTTYFSWKYYELHNYYQIVAPGAQLDTLRIYYDDPNGGIPLDRDANGKPYLQILGIDKLPMDNIPDDYSSHGYGFDQARGLLIFPDPMPFASLSLPDPDLEIYTNPDYSFGMGKYYMYKRTISIKQTFDLPANTKRVTVYVNDVVMDSTKDYIVDYDEGKLEFRKPIPPTARVRIQVEYSPFFSLSQKSLVGMRASTKLLGDGMLGSSFFYRTEGFQASPFDHLQLKDEPFNRMVLETDFALPQNLPYLTNAVDWLPLVETEAESKLNINFEGAYSFSNLNTRGAVYLDDLEATTITKPVQITRVSWTQSSLPVNEDTANFVHNRLVWYNPQGDDRLEARHIYLNPQDPNEIADVLQIIYRPDDTLSFGGLTQYITNENFDECENLEFIIKAGGGVMNIDLAQAINEDQLRRNSQGQLVGLGSMQDEDRHPQNWAWNELQEDTGLDSVFGDDGTNAPGDDGNDDFNENDHSGGINGTEGNRVWDTENIDHDSNFNRKNFYYGYSINLDSTKYAVNAGLQSGWKMFRIPIKDSTNWTKYGTPDWHNIKYVRIWFTRIAQQETLLVYKLNVTGSRWKNYGVADGDTLSPVDSSEVFTITPVNTETHSYYKPPYPLQTNPLTGKTINEGGLELKLENIKNGHVCVAHRRTEENEDYRSYDTLTFYFRAMHSNPIIFLRIGADTINNYYEYNTDYLDGTSIYNDWRVYTVAMKDFLDLKKRTEGIGTITEGNYRVVGNPSISANKYFEIRVENTSLELLTDTMWFNDVKLTSPRSEVGKIFRASSSLNFADLSSFSFSYDESDGRFRRLSEPKDITTQSAARSYGANANFTLNKFLPNTWGYNIPLGLSYHKSIQEPRFSSFIANDVELEGAERLLERSASISRGYSLHFSKSNSKNWLMKYTLDKLSLDHDRSQNMSASARNVDTSDVKNYRGSYTLDPKVTFKVLRQVFSVLPQNLSFSALYNDNAVKSYYRNSPDSAFERSYGYPQRRRTLSPSFNASYSPHSIMNSQYNFSQMRDSVSEHRRFGEEVGRNQSFNANASKSLFILNPSLSVGSSYNEDHRFEMRQPVDYRSITNSARFQVSSPVDVKKCVRFLTRLRDETKDTLQIPGSPLWIIKQIEVFVDKLRNPSVSFSRQRSSGYITDTRPDLRFQWGLADTIPTINISPNSYSARNTGDNFGISSGIDYNLVSLSASYSTQSTKAFGASGTENRTRSKTYPAADLRLSRIEQLPFLKRFAYSSSINLRYDQNYQLQYQYTAANDSLDLLSDSKTMSFSPLLGWQVSWVKGISTNASVNYGETESHQYSDTYVNPSKSTTRGGSLSISYTFSAPKGIKIPLLQGIKFNSNLTTNLGINYNRNTSYAADQENPNVLDEKNPIGDSESRGFNILLTYNFSTSITGGANFDYAQNRELNTANDSKRVGLSFYMNINF